jgi:predicted nucleic-acid-binding protein
LPGKNGPKSIDEEAGYRYKCTDFLCPQNVLTDFVYVLEKVYHHPKPQIRAMIADLLGLPGVQIVHALDVEMLLKLWPDPIPDFGDAW